jgi:hypothetical protein
MPSIGGKSSIPSRNALAPLTLLYPGYPVLTPDSRVWDQQALQHGPPLHLVGGWEAFHGG